MCTGLRLCLPLMWLLCFCGTTAAEAGTGCKVVNLMPAFWRSLAKSDASAQIRATLIVPYPDLYNDNYVNLPKGAKWDAAVARERTYVEAHREEVSAAESYLVAHARPLMARSSNRHFLITSATLRSTLRPVLAKWMARLHS